MRLPIRRFAAPSSRAVPAPLLAALLYAAALIGANPAAAQSLTPDQRGELEALRAGEMRKLVVHPEPVPVPGDPVFDRDGGEHSLSESDGKIRVVNFWATWCAPCREEFPALDALEKTRGGPDFQVIPIATGRNDPAAIDRFNREVGITALADGYLDPKSKLARGMDVMGLPVTLILNREGGEIARLMGGADWSGADAKVIFDYLAALPG
ncbi:TlpA disulfide reductase family protein [Amaricoccus solimangrovi]|nr:TlpA disulfide reductase family protein [Amaricoccus solimangrovi]